MRLVKADKAMEIYYWEDEGVNPNELAGTIVTIGFAELVLIPEGFDDAGREAILNEVWPNRFKEKKEYTATEAMRELGIPDPKDILLAQDEQLD